MLICLRFSTIQQIEIILFGIRYKYKYIYSTCVRAFVRVCMTFRAWTSRKYQIKSAKNHFTKINRTENIRLNFSECSCFSPTSSLSFFVGPSFRFLPLAIPSLFVLFSSDFYALHVKHAIISMMKIKGTAMEWKTRQKFHRLPTKSSNSSVHTKMLLFLVEIWVRQRRRRRLHQAKIHADCNKLNVNCIE